MRVDAVEPGEVVHGVQAALVLVEPLEPDPVPQDGQELVEVVAVLVVVQDLLLGVLPLLDVDDPDLELGLDEDLVQLEELLRSVGQLAQGQRGVEVDLSAQGAHHLVPVVPAVTVWRCES